MYFIDDYENSLKAKGKAKASVNAYLADVDDFEQYLNAEYSKPLENATKDEITNYLYGLYKHGKSDSTINRRIASLKSFYSYLLSINAISESPVKDIKTEKIEPKELVYMTIPEINQLLELPDDSDAGKRDKALLELMYASGIRASELCNVNVKDIDLKIGYISIHSNGKSRMVPLGRPCQYAINDYLNGPRTRILGKKDDCNALFLSYLGERITRQGIWKILKNYAVKTSFPEKISPQTIRNTFAAHLIQNGADLKSLQELLGHEDIMATKIYLSVAKNRILDVYDKAFPRA